MIKLLGFAPDADSTTPGVLTACTNFIPTTGGFKGAPAPANVEAAALAAACRGASLLTDLTGARRLIAGTVDHLYELAGATWTDRSRSAAPTSGTAYALGTDDRWSIVQYANKTLAVTPTDYIQESTTGQFTNVAGSATNTLKAKIIEAAQGFAVVFNTVNFTDEWYCCAHYDPTDWTPAVSTECVKGRLIGSPGPILAAKRFGDRIVAYKLDSMYLGSYVGAPEVWRWEQVSTDVGCVGQDAVVDTPAGHIFMGKDSLYVYDGTTPRPLGVGVIRDWLARDIAGSYQFKTSLLFDKTAMLVWIYYVGAGATVVNRCVVYDLTGSRFGVAHTSVEAVLTYSPGTGTYTTGSPTITTYESPATVPYDSLLWITGANTPAVFNTAHSLCSLAGSNVSASFTTGDFGDDEGYRMCRNLRVRYTSAPTTSVTTGYTTDELGTTLVAGSSASKADGRHPMRQTARWHSFKVDTTGDFKVTGIRPEFVEAGRR